MNERFKNDRGSDMSEMRFEQPKTAEAASALLRLLALAASFHHDLIMGSCASRRRPLLWSLLLPRLLSGQIALDELEAA